MLDDALGILATRETGGAGTGIESAGVAEGIAAAVTAGTALNAGDTTGCETADKNSLAAASAELDMLTEAGVGNVARGVT